ncbi:MAG TPA: HAD-IC family P-type ATPase [Rhodocyclaceae bacterium]|nr:HAD-IC family P-type ATPase [Rhodocyclaceae bacterium]
MDDAQSGTVSPPAPDAVPDAFWAWPLERLAHGLELTSPEAGLTSLAAQARLAEHGGKQLVKARRSDVPALLARQFRSPIVLILMAAALLAFAVHDHTDAMIILAIVFASAGLGFRQEYRATRAVERLLELVELHADVLRDGATVSIPADEVVPGDVVVLAAGDCVPGDCRLLASRDLFVDEASLTGESFPVEKHVGELPAHTPLAARSNALFLGTHVVSGKAQALVVRIGRDTHYGAIAERLRVRPAETEFELGVRHFGAFLMRVTLLLVVGIFAINVWLERPVIEAFLFALALAVGLTPEMLPAIISVTLANGARHMAARKVIVKRLASIENFGSMDVLCTDKTGTLTEGHMRLDGALDVAGADSAAVLRLAAINAWFQTSFRNPIDEAIRAAAPRERADAVLLDEIPYDFVRKRLSILARIDGEAVLVVKGAVAQVLEACATVELTDGTTVAREDVEADIAERVSAFAARGLRTLAVATRRLPGREGRTTFANTMKYVFMATSANFGNMFSVAGASLFLPFLPLLPKQILLNNLLTDIPAMALSTDRVDADWIERPRRWNVRFVRDYMLSFGLLSSVFDFLTFAVLLLVLHASPELFRSAWFVESVVSATLIVLVIRTRQPFARSRPSRALALATPAVAAVAVALPYTALAAPFGFVALPPSFLAALALIVLAYLAAAELLKRRFFGNHRKVS